MDDWLIARFQSIVNFTQKKPMWWLEQGTFLIAIASIGRFMNGSGAWSYFGVFVDGLVTCLIWLSSRSEVYKELTFGYHRKMVRLYTVAISAIFLSADIFVYITLGKLSLLSMFSDLWLVTLICCYYFGCCQDPPPPKPKTKMAFNGGGA